MASQTSFPIGRDPRLLIGQFLVLSLTFAAMVMFNVASSEHLSWHQKTLDYEVFLGVVPASVARQDEKLVRLHKVARHGRARQGPTTYHVLVTIFRPSGTERVVDASVVAELVENDLIHLKRSEKPLEMMSMDGAVTYCNFFDLHWNGEYRINVKIREPGKGAEKVSFLQAVYDLPK